MKIPGGQLTLCFLMLGGLCATLLGGCAHLSGETPQFVRNGVEYGTTPGTFRGRWWNYYTRGASLLDGGFYAEAERDFRTALITRKKDQLWPRTYGLHFLSDYFPHRELGIAAYYQGNLDTADTELQLSLGQQHSARAAYFLDQIRRQKIAAAGGDHTPPAFEVLSGLEGIAALEFDLAGRASDDHYVSQVFVNDAPVDVRVSAPTIEFHHPVRLKPGENALSVRVIDLAGNEMESRVALSNDVDGPVVSFDAVTALPGQLAGVVYDPSGIEYIEVLDEKFHAAPADNTTATVSLSLDAALTPPLVYRAVDRLGNVTMGEVPLPGAPSAARTTPGPAFFFAPRPYWLPSVAGAFLLAATPTAEGALRAELPSLLEGQQFFSEEIVVSVLVSSSAPLTAVTLNGETLPVIPARNVLNLSRRFALESGENTFNVSGVDANGNQGSDEKHVSRVELKVENVADRLSVAFLGNIAATPNPETADLAQQVFDGLANHPLIAGAKGRFRVVDRSQMEAVLAEQELSASDLVTRKLATGLVLPAEAVFAGRVRQDAETVEVVLEGVSTETTEPITSRVEVAGPITEIERLTGDLALRLVQEFPRAKGIIIDHTGENFTTDLGRIQGMKTSYKCLIYRPVPVVHPTTKQVLGYKPPSNAYQGVLLGVDDTFSTGTLLALEGAAPADYDIQPEDVVLAK